MKSGDERWRDMEEQTEQGAVQPNDKTEQMDPEVKSGKGRKKKRGFRLTGCLPVKILAFFLLFISAVAGVASGVVCCSALEEGWYIDREEVVVKDALHGNAYRVADTVRQCLQNDEEKSALYYLMGINAEVAILPMKDVYDADSGVFLWQSYEKEAARGASGFYSDLYVDIDMHFLVFSEEGNPGEEEPEYTECIFRVFFDPEFKIEDDIRQTYEFIMRFYQMRYAIIGVFAGSVVLFFICFVFLLCGAGHKNGREEIVPGVLTNIHFDILSVAVAGLICVLFCFLDNVSGSGVEWLIFEALFWVIVGSVAMLWLIDFAVRLKLGGWWKHTLVYVVLRMLWRGLRFLGRGIGKLIAGLPMVLTTVIAYLGICILELFGCCLFVEPAGIMLWAMEKVLLFVIVLYVALTCRRLLTASEKLAEGKEDYRVDTGYMFGAFKEHGENLNSLGQGISRAVAERMRSEHLKTELITNVSHDLKTPLTSIINYANLICEEKTENPRIEEYSEVLLRQSGRLKKLLEDLVEASKAMTGNLEVNPEPCEVGVLLTQAVGEYQQRMEEKSLELKVSQPEMPVKVLADGRHLWRVFDNLLNNICKYAQENSRVYLSLEQREEKVYIIFRNMSKYALDISAEELEERFVRGDKSRHMEGNGLGLSIAKSLTELQKGTLNIVIDGDLFKVTLVFDALCQ